MAWVDAVVVGQSVKFGADSFKEQVPIASWKIPAAHATCEEDITAEDFAGFVTYEAEGPWAVPWESTRH